MKTIQALIISAFLLGTCIAYPNMAGHCKSGPISDHAPSLHGAIGDSNLDNGNYFLIAMSTAFYILPLMHLYRLELITISPLTVWMVQHLEVSFFVLKVQMVQMQQAS